MKKKTTKRPEDLDAQMDMLDIAGLDDIETRLPMIEGVEYTKPRTWAEIFRDEDGHDPVPATR